MQNPDSNKTSDGFRLTLLATPSLEEPLVDCLLEMDLELDFTLALVYAHASGREALSLGEQVSGRKKRIRLEVTGRQTQIQAFRDRLKEDFLGADIHFTLESLIEAGRL